MRQFNLPEEKLNELAQSVSEKLLSNHFFDQNVILGEELKSFSDHNQINKFLIFQVYQVWDIQVNKLKHPYFDFDNDDVQETLQTLKNNLSRHIRISKEDFLPVLKRAVYNNLKLLVDPQETFDNFFFIQSEKLPLDVYKRYTQFFSDLGFVVNSILKYYEKNQIETVEKDVFFLKMKKVVEIYNKKSDKGFDIYREELFQSLTGASIADIESELSAQKEAEEAKRQAEEAKRQAEEARRQAEEEAKRQAEEEARRQEEEEKRRAEEERIRAEEEARKREEEARRLEEEARKKEEAKKQSFFDSLGADDDSFDLDLDLDDESDLESETSEVVEENAPVLVEEVVEEIVEEEATPVLEETPQEEPTPVVETIVKEVQETIEEVVEEVAEETPVVETPVVEEPAVETVGEPVAEKTEEFMEMAANMEPEAPAVEEEPPMIPETNGTPKESTVSFLDRFLSEKENGVSSPEPERPTSILDKLKERPSSDEPKRIIETLNGNRKIKLDEIPIHKQYQYVQKVFDGNNVRFRIIVDKINNAKNKAEVEDILDKFVFSNDELDQNDAVVTEFIELLRNRF